MAGEPTPVDPYGEPPVRVVRAPNSDGSPSADGAPATPPRSEIREPGEGGVRVVQAPGASGADSAAVSEIGEPTNPYDVSAPAAPSSDRTSPPVRVAQAPSKAQTPYQANKQAIDARAMADVLTGGASDGAKPRTMSFGNPPRASDAEPRGPAAGPASGQSISTAPTTSSGQSSGQSISTAPMTSSAPTASSAPTTSTALPPIAVALARGEVDAALADFGRLTASFHGSFSPSGVVLDAVRDGTLFQRAGLRAGDVIASVDGVRLRSLDDAANVYARASTAKALTAQIVRGGKPMTLHVAIR